MIENYYTVLGFLRKVNSPCINVYLPTGAAEATASRAPTKKAIILGVMEQSVEMVRILPVHSSLWENPTRMATYGGQGS